MALLISELQARVPQEGEGEVPLPTDAGKVVRIGMAAGR
jgi:hypothetical protein